MYFWVDVLVFAMGALSVDRSVISGLHAALKDKRNRAHLAQSPWLLYTGILASVQVYEAAKPPQGSSGLHRIAGLDGEGTSCLFLWEDYVPLKTFNVM